MTALQEHAIPANHWRKKMPQFNGRLSRTVPSGNGAIAGAQAYGWEPMIDRIVAMQHLGDDWDGLGAEAPSRELLESAIGLAYLLEENGMEPAHAVSPGPSGTVLMVWENSDGSYCEVEIVRPLFAEVFIKTPGEPSQHWTING
jgi:hypothetical protein